MKATCLLLFLFSCLVGLVHSASTLCTSKDVWCFQYSSSNPTYYYEIRSSIIKRKLSELTSNSWTTTCQSDFPGDSTVTAVTVATWGGFDGFLTDVLQDWWSNPQTLLTNIWINACNPSDYRQR
eukprot:PhF_6_TR40142/c0_g1_i1/m.59448